MYTAKIGKAFWKGTIVPTLLHGMAVWAKKIKKSRSLITFSIT